MTTSTQYLSFRGFGPGSQNESKLGFPTLRNGSVGQPKIKSPWSSSRSIWDKLPAEFCQPSSEDSHLPSNRSTHGTGPDPKGSLYPPAPPFGSNPWGKQQYQSAQPESLIPISLSRRSSAFPDSYQHDRPIAGIESSSNNVYSPLPSNPVKIPTLTNSINIHSSPAPWNTSPSNNSFFNRNSMLTPIKGLDQDANSQALKFSPWGHKPETREEWVQFGVPQSHISDTDASVQHRTSHGDPGAAKSYSFAPGHDLQVTRFGLYTPPGERCSDGTMPSNAIDLETQMGRIQLDEAQPYEHGERAQSNYGGDQQHSAIPVSNGYHSKEVGQIPQFEPFSNACPSTVTRNHLPAGGYLPSRLLKQEKLLPPFQRSYDQSRSNYSMLGSPYDRGTTMLMNRPTEPLVDQRSRMIHSKYEDGDMSVANRDRACQSRQQVVDARSSHMRGPPSPQYRYGVTPEVRMNGMPGFLQMPSPFPAMLSNIGLPRFAEPSLGHNFRSALLEEFKSNTKGCQRFELRDIYDHIVEFSGDQNGSRFIQDKLLTATSDEKNRVFLELLPNALQLMMDVFGNYVIQRFFERGDQNQKRTLVSKMQGHVLALANHVYGCRAVQSAFHYVLVDEQVSLVRELEPNNNVLKCVRDQNGNHVIQAAIEYVPSKHIQFIIDAFIGQVHQLATHAYGCRVVQRLLKYWSEPGRSTILREVHACTPALISDQYGNYVIQYMLENEPLEDRDKIINVVRANLVALATQKFASNVVERCFSCGTEEQRREMMFQLSTKDERGETPLTFMIKDAYGNYVIQTLLDTLENFNYAFFVNILNPEIARAKRFVPNKQAENVAKKMHRLDHKSEYARGYSCHMTQSFHARSSGIPPPISTAILTPPSTADGQRTPLSGSLPSNPDERHPTVRAFNQNFKPHSFGYNVYGP